MTIEKVIPILVLVMSVSCWDFNSYGLDSIQFDRGQFQLGHAPYEPVSVPLRSDINGQVKSEPPDTLRKEISTIKPPSTYLEPPVYSQAVLNRNAEVEVVNKVEITNDSAKSEPKLINALGSFGFNLLKDISKTKAGNSVISPYSVANLMSLLQQGASGASKQQITDALQLQSHESAALFQKISDEMKKRKSHNIVEIANNIFIGNEFDLSKEFKTNAINNFRSDVTPLSFSNNNAASQTINKWVSDKTRNKINNLISPDAIGQHTQLVLLNAIYFKGAWSNKFNINSTLPRPFHLRNGQTKMTPFMTTFRMFKSGYDPKIKADIIIIPFENDEYSMMVLLPRGIDEMDYMLSALTQVNLKDYHDKLTFQEIHLEIPKFNIKEQVDLVPILKKMGVTDVFSWKSNLGGIGLYRSLAPRVDSAIHSAVLSIDEEGGTAAGATAFTVVALMYEDIPDIKMNRPFVVVFWDNKLSNPLFVARIEDPTL